MFLSVSLCFCLSLCVSVCLSLCFCLSLSVFLSLSLSLLLCLSCSVFNRCLLCLLPVPRVPLEPPGGGRELMERSGGPHSDGSNSPTWERDRRGPPPPPGHLGPPGACVGEHSKNIQPAPLPPTMHCFLCPNGSCQNIASTTQNGGYHFYVNLAPVFCVRAYQMSV